MHCLIAAQSLKRFHGVKETRKKYRSFHGNLSVSRHKKSGCQFCRGAFPRVDILFCKYEKQKEQYISTTYVSILVDLFKEPLRIFQAHHMRITSD